MAANASDLKSNAIPRRTRRSTYKIEKCPPRRETRDRFRTVPSSSQKENGTGKNILDVHRMISDLAGVRKALCHENRLDGKSNRKTDKIFGEVMESILHAYTSKKDHNVTESSPAIEPCSTSDSSFRIPETSVDLSDLRSNSECQIGDKIQPLRNPTYWKPKKNFAVVDEDSSEDQMPMSRNSSATESSREPFQELESSSHFEEHEYYPFLKARNNKNFMEHEVMRSHVKGRQLKEWDMDSRRYEPNEEVLSKFEDALRKNSKGRKGRIPKEPRQHWLDKNQNNIQRVQEQHREVQTACSNQHQICPTCVCITSQRGQKSITKDEYKAKPRKHDQKGVQPDFDDKFRYRRKGTDDVRALNEWRKPDTFTINSDYQRKIGQENTPFRANNIFERDFLDNYKRQEFQSKPQKFIKISKCAEPSFSKASLAIDMKNFIKELDADNFIPAREKHKTFAPNKQLDHELGYLDAISSRKYRTERQDGRNHLEAFYCYEENFPDHEVDNTNKGFLNDTRNNQIKNARKYSSKKVSPKEKYQMDDFQYHFDDLAFETRITEKHSSISPKKRCRTYQNKKETNEVPKQFSEFMDNTLAPIEEQNSWEPVPETNHKILFRRNKVKDNAVILKVKKEEEGTFHKHNFGTKQNKVAKECVKHDEKLIAEEISPNCQSTMESDDFNETNQLVSDELEKESSEGLEPLENIDALKKMDFGVTLKKGDDVIDPSFVKGTLESQLQNKGKCETVELLLERGVKNNKSSPDKISKTKCLNTIDQELNIEIEESKAETESKANPPKTKKHQKASKFALKNLSHCPVEDLEVQNVEIKGKNEDIREECVHESSVNFPETAEHCDDAVFLENRPSCSKDRDVLETVSDKVRRWDEGCGQQNEAKSVASTSSTRDMLKKFNSGSDMAFMLYGSPIKTFDRPELDSGVVPHQRQKWKITPPREIAPNHEQLLDNNQSPLGPNCMDFDQRFVHPIHNQHNPVSRTLNDQDGHPVVDYYSQYINGNQMHIPQSIQSTNEMIRTNATYPPYEAYGNLPFLNPMFLNYMNSVGMLHPNAFMPRAEGGISGNNTQPQFPSPGSALEKDSEFQPKFSYNPNPYKANVFNQQHHDVSHSENVHSRQISETASQNESGVQKEGILRHAQNLLDTLINGDASAHARINKNFNESHQAFNSPPKACDTDTTPLRTFGSNSLKYPTMNDAKTKYFPDENLDKFASGRETANCHQTLAQGTPMNPPKELAEDHQANSTSRRDNCQLLGEFTPMNRPRDLSEAIRDKSTSGRDMKRVLYGAEDSPFPKQQAITSLDSATESPARPSERVPVPSEMDRHSAGLGKDFSRLNLNSVLRERRRDLVRRPKGIVPGLDNGSFN